MISEQIAELDSKIRAKQIDATQSAIEKLDMNVASIMDAFLEGMGAGKMLLSPSLNPFVDMDCDEHQAWERGRFAAVSIRLAGEVA